jgi:hypothetical protein
MAASLENAFKITPSACLYASNNLKTAQWIFIKFDNKLSENLVSHFWFGYNQTYNTKTYKHYWQTFTVQRAEDSLQRQSFFPQYIFVLVLILFRQ